MDISPWSAADEGVWAFLSLVVAPDVAVWRYPDRHPDRILGGYRNVFRRLWWRAELLGSGPEDPPALLGEDQLVAIMERTDAIGSDAVVARALCRAIIEGQANSPRVSAMDLMRDAAKRVSRATSVRLLPALDEVELNRAMKLIVEDTTAALQDHRRR